MNAEIGEQPRACNGAREECKETSSVLHDLGLPGLSEDIEVIRTLVHLAIYEMSHQLHSENSEHSW